MEKTEYGLLYDGADRPTKKQRYGVLALIFIMLILIILLFILYANDDDDNSKKVYIADTISSVNAEQAISASAIGYALSLTGTGKSILGGGTSVYKDVTIMSTLCPKFVNIDSIFEDSFVSTAADTTKGTTTVSLLSSTSPKDVSLSSSADFDGDVYDIATLDAANGVFAMINQDVSQTEDDATIAAGVVSTDGTITFGTPAVYGGVYSLSPAITRLSDNSFAVCYFDNTDAGAPVAITRYGVVDSATLAVSLSPEVVFADNTQYGVHFTVVGLSATSYVIGYYNGTQFSDENVAYGPLQVMSVNIDGAIDGETEANGNVVLGNPSTLDIKVAFDIASARVSETSAILTYAEMSSNFGITSTLVSLDSDGSVSFGSSLAMTSGRAIYYVQNGLLMDLDVVVMGNSESGSNGASAKFAVMYSDITNNGKLTTTVGMITRSAELIRASPDFILNSGNADPDTMYTWAALAPSAASTATDGTVALISAITPMTCNAVDVTVRLSVMDILPAPVGLVYSSTDSQKKGDVIFSGTMSGYSNLVTGAMYYTNTLGEILGGDLYYGSPTGVYDSYYEHSSSNTLLDASTSLVGIAISPDTLLLKMHG